MKMESIETMKTYNISLTQYEVDKLKLEILALSAYKPMLNAMYEILEDI